MLNSCSFTVETLLFLKMLKMCSFRIFSILGHIETPRISCFNLVVRVFIADLCVSVSSKQEIQI